MSRDYRLYIKDILKECQNIEKFVGNLSFEEFFDNLEKSYATLKSLENIDEAVKNIPKDILKKYLQIDWKLIAKNRDVLTHHYFGIDDEILWDTIKNNIEPLKQTIEKILKDLDENN